MKLDPNLVATWELVVEVTSELGGLNGPLVWQSTLIANSFDFWTDAF
jgi:hypothetical protein